MKRGAGSEHDRTYPQGENVLIIRLRGVPSWILSRLVGRNEMHKIKRCVQQGEARLVSVRRCDLGQDFRIPFSLCVVDYSVQVSSMWYFIFHIAARFLG